MAYYEIAELGNFGHNHLYYLSIGIIIIIMIIIIINICDYEM